MIALFDEPPRVTIKLKGLGTNGLLVGMAVAADHHTFTGRGVVCLEDGTATFLPFDQFTFDWRYEAEGDRWVDLNHQPADQEP